MAREWKTSPLWLKEALSQLWSVQFVVSEAQFH